ncbi:hypothetical protein [Kutzneria sp. NPDC051319]|uniref:hypothetical protein n=1 Tax=Kutzneria sp. NPDC051319 TaxID=3155047 RepID=UPI0034273706
MDTPASSENVQQGWDEPWYRVRTDRFEASFLPNPDDDLDAVCDIDVVVVLADGSRWTATMFTLEAVDRLMEKWARSGEALGGRFFWCSDGLIVREPGIENMVQVIGGLLDIEEFGDVFRRCEAE